MHRVHARRVAIALVACAFSCGAAAEDSAKLDLASALREALRQNPNTLIQQQQVGITRGSMLQALGQFDPVLTASASRGREIRKLRRDESEALGRGASGLNDPLAALLGLSTQAGLAPPTAQYSNNTTYSLGVEQTLRSGATVGATAGVTSLYDNVSALNDIPPQTSGRVGFSLRTPLLRYAGTEVTTANLTAAEAELEASANDTLFVNAQTLLGTALSYWDFLARLRRLDIARDAERRAARLVDETRKLIGADEMPAADIQLVQASHAERLAARIAAEQAVAEGRRNLALQIGLPPEHAQTLPTPANDFPALERETPRTDRQIPALQSYALLKRADLEAARQREQAARYRVVFAQSALKPQVDLSMGVNYGSLLENRGPYATGHVLGSGMVGPSMVATLAMQLPFRNTAAQGNFISASSALEANTIRVRSLADAIGANVGTAAMALTRAALQLAQSMDTTRHYRVSVANERTKHRMGLATLIDVINVEDRLTNALIAEVQARQAYAAAIVQLRFEVGGIVAERGGGFEVDIDSFFSPRFDTEH